MSSAASSGTADTSSNTHMGKGARTCSSSSGFTFAKVFGKHVVSLLVGFGTALACHHRSVMNAMFAHEFIGTDIERQQSLNAVVMNTSSFSNFTRTAGHGVVDIETAPFSTISSLASFHLLAVRVGGCVSRYSVS